MRRIGVTAAAIVFVLAFGALAVRVADGRGGGARAHSCTTIARDILAEARPALQGKGCDAGPLL